MVLCHPFLDLSSRLHRRQLLQVCGSIVGLGGAGFTLPVLSSSSPVNDLSFSFEVVTLNNRGERVDRQQQSVDGFRESPGDGIFLDLIQIPPGEFIMGSPPAEAGRWEGESPQHRVTIAGPFWMGRTPVTQAQWRAVAALPRVDRALDPDPSFWKGTHRPVEQIGWSDAVEFCARLSRKTGKAYRLPSEAEWEYACRAGTVTPFHWGPTMTPELANYQGNYTYGLGPAGIYREETTQVRSFGVANAFGLYDMHGNVWEWCADPWHDSYQGAPGNGQIWQQGGDQSRRVLRGGSWFSHPNNCRSAYRNHVQLAIFSGNIGFRVCCDDRRFP